MKHHVLIDLSMFAIGYVLSAVQMYLWDKVLTKYNFSMTTVVKRLWTPIGSILILLFLIGIPVAFCIAFSWLEVGHDYFTDGDISNTINCVVAGVLANFYIPFVTKDLPKGRTW